VVAIVNRIWQKYDKDRSGALNKKETLRFVDDFLAQRGQPPATMSQFTRFYDQYDSNGDGLISKREMANFVRLFKPEEDEVV
jgi:Ca2+-binding EF-hand superfamily protein